MERQQSGKRLPRVVYLRQQGQFTTPPRPYPGVSYCGPGGGRAIQIDTLTTLDALAACESSQVTGCGSLQQPANWVPGTGARRLARGNEGQTAARWDWRRGGEQPNVGVESEAAGSTSSSRSRELPSTSGFTGSTPIRSVSKGRPQAASQPPCRFRPPREGLWPFEPGRSRVPRSIVEAVPCSNTLYQLSSS